MKRIMVLPLAIAGLMAANAVTLPLEVSLPEVKLVKSENGVNVRQQPSTTAKKLIYKDEDADFGLGPLDVAKWSATTPRGYESLKFYGPGVVLNESNGWYEIKDYGPEAKGSGWVSAKFCKPYTPLPLVYNKIYDYGTSPRWFEVDGVKYAILMQSTGGSDFGPVILYLGRLVDGMIVCPAAFGSIDNPVLWGYGESQSRAQLISPENNDYHQWVYLPPVDTDCYNCISAIDDSIVQEIVRLAKPLANPVTFFLYDDTIWSF